MTAPRFTIRLGFAVGFCLTSAPVASAEIVERTSDRDNTLYQSPDGNISNGAGEHLFVGRVGASALRRGLVRFDVAGAVSAAAEITSVTLTMSMSRTSAGPVVVALHRATAAWGEGASDADGEEGAGAEPMPGDATWIHRFFDSEAWATPGGDFDPALSATLIIDAIGIYAWESTPRLEADVQTWIDDPSANFGWVLVGDETMTSAKRFDTHENPDPLARPRLTIEFTPAPVCVGDLNHDGDVGLSDLALMLSSFGLSDLPPSTPGDLDDDGDIDLSDLAMLLSQFGTVCR